MDHGIADLGFISIFAIWRDYYQNRLNDNRHLYIYKYIYTYIYIA